MNTGEEREMLDSSWLIFCSILVARMAPAISDWGAEKVDLPSILYEPERRLNWPSEQTYMHVPYPCKLLLKKM